MRRKRTFRIAILFFILFIQTGAVFAVSQHDPVIDITHALTAKAKMVVEQTEGAFQRAADTMVQKKSVTPVQPVVTTEATSFWKKIIGFIAEPFVPVFSIVHHSATVLEPVAQAVETHISAGTPIAQVAVTPTSPTTKKQVSATPTKPVVYNLTTSQIAALRKEMLTLNELTRAYARDLESSRVDSLARSLDRSLAPVVQQITNTTVTTVSSGSIASISETVDGLDHAAGVLSTTAGYVIPLTASTTEWSTFYQTPSSRITAGTGLSWSGNTLNAIGGGSGTVGTGTTGQIPYYAADGAELSATSTLFISASGNVGVGTTNPTASLTVNKTGGNLLDLYGSGTHIRHYNNAGVQKMYQFLNDGQNTYEFTSSTDFQNIMSLNYSTKYVGIGTNAPGANLDVKNYARFLGSANSATGVPTSGEGVEITYDSSGNVGYIFAYDRDAATNRDLLLGVNGSNQLYLKANGNVGIGTTTPSALLSLYKNSPTTNQTLFNIGTSDDGSRFSVDEDGDVNLDGGLYLGSSNSITQSWPNLFFTSNTVTGMALRSDMLRVAQGFTIGWAPTTSFTTDLGPDTTFSRLSAGVIAVGTGSSGETDGTLIVGNVGIGTTTPTQKLVSVGDASYYALMLDNNSSNGSTNKWRITPTGSAWGAGDNKLVFTYEDTTSSNSKFTIDGSTGNVGIGTSSPQERLHIYDASASRMAIDVGLNGVATMRFKEANIDKAYYSYNANTDLLQFGTQAAGHQLVFNSGNNVEAMRIDASGNVGIGTTTPSSLLSVSGTTTVAYNSGNQFLSGTTLPNSVYKNVFYNSITNDYGRLALFNLSTAATNSIASSMTVKTTSTGDMANGIGSGFLYAIEDVAGVENFLVRTAGVRDGADNTGKFQIDIANAGVIGTTATFLASGNVGIGTTTPASLLTLQSLTAPEISIYNSTSLKNWRIGSGVGSGVTNTMFGIADGSTSRFVIDGSGNIGIGTNPTQKLDVDGNIFGRSILYSRDIRGSSTDGNLSLRGSDRGDSSQILIKGLSNGSDIQLLTDTTGAVNTATEQMVLKSSGNFGIGTTTPASKLHVVGSTYPVMTVERSVSATTGFNSGMKLLARSSGSTVDGFGPSFLFEINDSDTLVQNIIGRFSAVRSGADNSGALVFGVVNAGSEFEGMRILPSGNLGIGTTTPGQKLTVAGNAQFTSVTSGAYSSDLNLTADGTLTTSASDIRLKENLTELSTSTLDKIRQLKAYTFNWKTDPEHRVDVGLIAQDVEFVFPELVFTNKTDGFKGVNYSRLSIFLLKGIQEQQVQLDELKKYTAVLNLKELHTEKLCVGSATDEVCITKDELKNLLRGNSTQQQTTGAVVAPPISTDITAGVTDSIVVADEGVHNTATSSETDVISEIVTETSVEQPVAEEEVLPDPEPAEPTAPEPIPTQTETVVSTE